MLLPVMPTTVFLILALACFTRSNDKLANWLLSHPRFGKTLSNWQTRRVIPMKAKHFATFGMLISLVIIWVTSHSLWLTVFCLLLFSLVVNYLFSKPSVLDQQTHKRYFKLTQGVLLALLCHFVLAWIIFFKASSSVKSTPMQQPTVIAIELVAAQAPQPEVYDAKKIAAQAMTKEQLIQRLTEQAAIKPQPILHIRGDKTTEYQNVVFLMEQVQQAGINSMSFITEENKK
ncbi:MULTISPECIES: DUF454 family protein [Pseudoalteromonas]